MTLTHHDGSPLHLVQVTNSTGGRAHADAIDAALGAPTTRIDGPAKEGLPRAWGQADVIVSHLALGATTRIVAPLIGMEKGAKKTDPGLVVVDEGGQFVVAVLGGHAKATNQVAQRLAEILGATPVVTTATDTTGVAALDTLGWPFAGDVAGVTRSILEGKRVDLDNQFGWPLPEFPNNVISEDPAVQEAEEPVGRVVVTDMKPSLVLDAALFPTVVLSPPTLVVGMGCNRGTDIAELRTHLFSVLDANLLARESVAALVSVDAKADEPGLLALADELGVPFRTYPADDLDAIEVPNPSQAASDAVGTRSVSEAAVVRDGAQLVLPKHKTPDSTVAVGRRGPRGRLAVVGLGAGAPDLVTPRARDRVVNAGAVVGYTVYVDQVRGWLKPGTHVVASGMGTEESRARTALELARQGMDVALVCSGDPAIYAMASPTLQVAAADVADGAVPVDIEIVPGVTASLASSSILGAPLGHDHVTLSLSDLHTSWDAIERRARAAAEGDFVTVLYNPRSKTRTWQLPRVLEIMAEHRPPTTPVAVVENATRPDERVVVGTLADFDVEEVTMFGMVVIGSSTTTMADLGTGAPVMVTPRDYQWMAEA